MHPLEVLLTPLGRAFRSRRSDPAASLANAPELVAPAPLTVTSTSFADGGVIPARHCGWLIGDDVSPALAWAPLPAGTVDILLVLEDLDSPGRMPRLHTVAALPVTESLAEGALGADSPGIRFLPLDGKPGRYAGPRPLPGHGPHHYRFHVYALDVLVDLSSLQDAAALPAAVSGHVLAAGVLTGTRTA